MEDSNIFFIMMLIYHKEMLSIKGNSPKELLKNSEKKIKKNIIKNIIKSK